MMMTGCSGMMMIGMGGLGSDHRRARAGDRGIDQISEIEVRLIGLLAQW